MTNTIRFGIALQSDKSPAEYVAQAAQIDAYAFDVVSVYNDLLFQPAFGPLLLMAPHLRTAQLGPAALNPYTPTPRIQSRLLGNWQSLMRRATGGPTWGWPAAAGSIAWASCNGGPYKRCVSACSW